MPRVSEKMAKSPGTGSPETTSQSSAPKMAAERGGEEAELLHKENETDRAS